MTTRTAYANGNRIRDYSHMKSSPARRLAAAIDRDHPAVDAIETSAGGRGACVKLVNGFGEERAETLPTPDGYTVDHINVVNTGATYVYYERVDA